MREKINLKFIMLGDGGVGKTSLMNRFVNGKFSNYYKPTIGADFLDCHTKADVNDYKLQIWDIAGEERLETLGIFCRQQEIFWQY